MIRTPIRTVTALAAFAMSSLISTGAFSQDILKIGLVSPQSGANARYGAFANKGANLAAKEINAAGGVLGKKIELVAGDSQCVPAEGVAATQRLITFDKAPIIIGDVCSSVTLAMQPLAEEAKVLLVNAASSNPDITYKAGVGGYKWTFRNYPTDEVRAAVVLDHSVKNKGFKKFAVLSVDSDYGRGAIKFTKKYLPKYPDAQILSEDYYKEAETDFRPVLSKIRLSGAQAVIMYGQADTTPIVARQREVDDRCGTEGDERRGGSRRVAARVARPEEPEVRRGLQERVRRRDAEQPRVRALGNAAPCRSCHQGCQQPEKRGRAQRAVEDQVRKRDGPGHLRRPQPGGAADGAARSRRRQAGDQGCDHDQGRVPRRRSQVT
jgi:Periplasmic binding protein